MEWSLAEELTEEGSGVACGALGDGFGRASGKNGAAAATTVGTKVDEVVGALNDVEVVLDDDDGVAFIDQTL